MSENFVPFGKAHIIMVIIIALFSTAALYAGRRLKLCHEYDRNVRIFLCVLLAIQYISANAYLAVTKEWSFEYDFPAHLCDGALILCCTMLITKCRLHFEIAYFWGIAGGMQAVITPALSYGPGHLIYYTFFISHGGIIAASLYAAASFGYRPNFRSVLKALTATNVFAFYAAFINVMTGGNYMFLTEKPANPSLLDFLLPWPFYILQTEVLALILYTLCAMPFILKSMASVVSTRDQ